MPIITKTKVPKSRVIFMINDMSRQPVFADISSTLILFQRLAKTFAELVDICGQTEVERVQLLSADPFINGQRPGGRAGAKGPAIDGSGVVGLGLPRRPGTSALPSLFQNGGPSWGRRSFFDEYLSRCDLPLALRSCAAL
jgi:hypothetical protein